MSPFLFQYLLVVSLETATGAINTSLNTTDWDFQLYIFFYHKVYFLFLGGAGGTLTPKFIKTPCLSACTDKCTKWRYDCNLNIMCNIRHILKAPLQKQVHTFPSSILILFPSFPLFPVHLPPLLLPRSSLLKGDRGQQTPLFALIDTLQ